MTNDEYLEIKNHFPNAPKTIEDHALLHDLLYKVDSNMIHMYGNGFVSVRYPSGEIYVFETKSDEFLAFKF